ncbi:hypothetical protein [uncultured Alistipes sp.]|mgnify:FL=1|uniref:hypothetical protein n=1 Tax=uncultured Alistipes sp. TaxID=538949 RepID=UPI0025E39D92|nr:hypothetical protein [uncultured Alistipes sp.]
MKNIWKGMAALLAGAALLTACGDDSTEPDGHVPAIDVTTRKLAPDATGSNGESGTTRAYVGTVVTAEGFNLDQVGDVTFDGVSAEIVEQTIKTLKFKVPVLDLAQRDDSYRTDLLVLDRTGNIVFRYEYYVTVPVTDALASGYSPAEGTVGTVVTIEGRNLEQVTEIRFADRTILSDAFTEVVAGAEKSSVSFAVPAGNYAAGESEVAIAAVWGGVNEIDVTGEVLFRMQTPRVDPLQQPEGTNSLIGDEVTMTGEYLDLLSEIEWGDSELIVLEQTASTLKVKFPSSIDATDPVVTAADIRGVYGEPAQPVVLAAAWRLDTTPQGPAKPVLKGMTAEDGKFYLGKVVTVTGENMASVEGFLVDGVAAELAGEPNDVQAEFIVPDGVTFTEATEVAVEVLYNGGTKVDFGTATIYPFYYYKDVTMGSGSSSVKNYPYPEYAWTNAFFLPDSGEVISTDTWVNEAVDAFARLSASNAAITSANTLNKASVTAEQYYGVQPYIFLSAASNGKLAFQNPANSASQLKTHRYEEGKTAVSSTFGTPIIFYNVLKEGATFDAVKAGEFTSMTEIEKVAGSSAPAFGTANQFVAGDVIAVQYVTYTKGAKPAADEDICKQGYMVVKEVTCGDAATGTATDLNGHVKFDFYWSKTLNE